MAVLSSITVDWRQSPRLITVASPVTSVSVQDIYDTLRDLEDEPVNLGYDHIISAGGKEPLDVALGTAVGITATLLNAVIEFEARGTPTVCKVSGGNLVAQDADALPIDPIVFTTNVLAIIAQSSSATINDVSLTQRLQHMIASQDATHSPYGDFYYWDPVNGDDTNDGLLPEQARLTFASIHDDLCSGVTRDTVILLARNPLGGSTIINERITITKDHILLHGPGRGCLIRGVDDTQDTITISGAYGVEIDSMRIQTGPGPTARNCVNVINSEHVKISNVFLDAQAGEYITGKAINIVGGQHHMIHDLFIENTGGHGIHLEDVISPTVERCKIFSSFDIGIHLASTTPGETDHVTLNDNVIQQSGVYDLQIDTGVLNTAVRFLNDLTNAGGILDNGTDTQWERQNQAQVSAFWNWEEQGGSHLVPGSVGFNAAAASYQGAVNIDTVNGTAGSVFGTNGTVGAPVNNLADAIILDSILLSRTYRVRGSITLISTHSDWTFIGFGVSPIVALGGQDVQGSFFQGCEISGNAADSDIHTHDCTLDNLTNFYGIFNGSRLQGSLSLAVGSTVFTQCVSLAPGSGTTPIIDVQGAGRTFQFRGYSGGIEIQNMNDAGNAGSIEIVGQVILAASCTNTVPDEALAIRGIGDLTNNGTIVPKVTSLLSNTSDVKPEIKQAWTRAVTGGSKMQVMIALELDGQVIALPGTATLDVIVRDSAGTAVIAQSGLSPNAAGYFAMTEDPYTPSAGANLASFATITNGADVYTGLTPISFPEFS